MIPRRRGQSAPAVKPPSVAPLNFQAIFDGYIESTKKQWGHDRTKTLGGSEVFGCIRKAWYSRNKTPKDPGHKESWGATRRGDLIENHHVVPAMEWGSAHYKFNMDYAGTDQVTLFAPDAPMSVTPDGLLHGLARNALALYGVADLESDCCMFEIKSIDPRVNLAEEKAIHHGQTQIQMGLVRETTAFKPVYAVLLYVNASFFDDMSVFIVKWDPAKYVAAKARAAYAYECDDPAKLTREGMIDGSCQYCPFQNACMATTIAGMPRNEKVIPKGKTSDPALLSTLTPLIEQARETGRLLKKATKADKLVKEDLKAALREADERRARDANWSISYSMSAGKESLDKDRMAEIIDGLREIIAEEGLTTKVDELLKNAGVDAEEGHNDVRLLEIGAFMKRGNPFEIMRVTYTEPDADDV